MKSLHFFALAVVAVLCLVIGYYVGTQSDAIPGMDMVASDEVKTEEAMPAKEPDSDVLATVNGENITEADIAFLYSSLPQQYRQAPLAMIKEQLLQQLISMEVISQAAAKENLSDNPEYKDRLDAVQTQLMQEFYIKAKIDELVTDELLKEEYDKIVAGFTPEEQLHARHILLKTEEEANDVIKLLDEGGDFAELAKEYSTGPSGPNGGDLGFFAKGSMVPEFADAAFNLKNGEYTKAPVESQFGFHVIKAEDRRNTEPPTFEEKKPELQSKVSNLVIDKLIEELKADASIILMTPTEDEKAAEKSQENSVTGDGKKE
ncbi:peptidylprolyl isomerase [uncultured Sneathiella sp.]|uniref:peptidylprolyl isomerase n=1 Tax=uncultured Sneathiella sp. TaxID=879315 RepID=UPI0030ED076E|tara:strand:- start:24585 stop:25538 length:954 start_codon:yes stop_codon:yes gene_type:complete